MQGTLKKLGDSYGFLENEDGDAFVPKRDLPADARNGDKYEYETEDRGGRNPVAIDVRRVSRGASGGNNDQRGRDRPERKQKIPLLTAEFLPSTVSIVDGQRGKKILSVAIYIKLLSDGKATGGIRAALFHGDHQIEHPVKEPSSNAHGIVFFRMYLPEKTTSADLALTIMYGATAVVVTHQWQKPEEKPKVATHLEVHEYPASEGILRIITTHDDKPIKGKIVVESVVGSELEGNVTGTADKKTGPRLEFDSDGSITVHVRIKTVPAGHFGGDHVIVKVPGTKLEFKPISLSYYQ